MKLPVLKVDRWTYRANRWQLSCCRMEAFYVDGIYCVLVTERGDNPGPSVTNSHHALRQELEKWLDIPKGMSYRFYEQYDKNSYSPPREDLSEVCQVHAEPHHWVFIPDDEWRIIYVDPRQPSKVIRRKAKDHAWGNVVQQRSLLHRT